MATNFVNNQILELKLKKINMTIYFENLTIALYVLNTHVKFCMNQILFIIQSITHILCIILKYKNLKFTLFIDDIVINPNHLEILQISRV